MKIYKFGGTLLATKALREKAIEEIKKVEKEKVIVVCSAMGRNGFPYATDTLLHLFDEQNIQDKELARCLSLGEILSSLLFTSDCLKNGVSARSISPLELGIHTDDTYLDATIKEVDAHEIEHALQECNVVIVPGFIGTNSQNEITTLGRGGGDLTPLALADYFHVKEVYLWKEVEGIFPYQPTRQMLAEPYEKIGYQEVEWLLDLGYTFVQKKAILFARKKGICIYVGNYDSPLITRIEEENHIENCIGLLATHQEVLLACHDPEWVLGKIQILLKKKHIFIKEFSLDDHQVKISLPSSQVSVAKREIIACFWKNSENNG